MQIVINNFGKENNIFDFLLAFNRNITLADTIEFINYLEENYKHTYKQLVKDNQYNILRIIYKQFKREQIKEEYYY